MTLTYLVIALIWLLGPGIIWRIMRSQVRRNPALQAEWRRQRVEEMMRKKDSVLAEERRQ